MESGDKRWKTTEATGVKVTNKHTHGRAQLIVCEVVGSVGKRLEFFVTVHHTHGGLESVRCGGKR